MRILRGGGEIAARYAAAFREIPGVIAPAVRQDVNPAWHLYPIRLDLRKLNADRGQVFQALRAENIGVNVHYIPVHRHPYYRDRFGYRGGEFPVAEDAYERLISLPMFHGMSDQDVEDVIQAVEKVFSHFRDARLRRSLRIIHDEDSSDWNIGESDFGREYTDRNSLKPEALDALYQTW